MLTAGRWAPVIMRPGDGGEAYEPRCNEAVIAGTGWEENAGGTNEGIVPSEKFGGHPACRPAKRPPPSCHSADAYSSRRTSAARGPFGESSVVNSTR
jgi:hypothetical protein